MRIAVDENGPPVEAALAPDVGAALRASGLVTVAPSEVPGRWCIGSNGKVGVARCAGVELRVAPKLAIRRLFFLLGFVTSGSIWREEDLPMSEASDLLNALAEAFSRQADRAVQQGLIQGYRVVEEALPVLRGRLREAEQMRRRFGLAVPVEVRYDDYTVDVPENQLLLAAAQRLLRLPGIGKRPRRSLVRLALRLNGVTPLVRGEPLPTWHPSRLNVRYHVALRLAEIVLRGGSLERDAGTVLVNGFMVDMPRVFEDFLSSTLDRALSVEGGRTRAQDRWHLDDQHRIPLRPDIVWYRDSGEVGAVVDAKYKAEKPSGFPNADLYQMLAYCTVLGLPEGHLVYAKGNEAVATHAVCNSGITIHQHALDLDTDPADLLEQVARLAGNITHR